MRCWHRNSEMSTCDLRSEVEGEDDLRAKKRVGARAARLGSFYGTRSECAIPIAKSKRRWTQFQVKFLGRVEDQALNRRRAGSWAGPTFRIRLWAFSTGRPLARFPPSGIFLTRCPSTSHLPPRLRQRFWNWDCARTCFQNQVRMQVASGPLFSLQKKDRKGTTLNLGNETRSGR